VCAADADVSVEPVIVEQCAVTGLRISLGSRPWCKSGEDGGHTHRPRPFVFPVTGYVGWVMPVTGLALADLYVDNVGRGLGGTGMIDEHAQPQEVPHADVALCDRLRAVAVTGPL